VHVLCTRPLLYQSCAALTKEPSKGH